MKDRPTEIIFFFVAHGQPATDERVQAASRAAASRTPLRGTRADEGVDKQLHLTRPSTLRRQVHVRLAALAVYVSGKSSSLDLELRGIVSYLLL